jgi:glycosyltransferase involved in cell wall biosynthesis
VEKIRVAHVINDMEVGGAQTQLLNLVRALDGASFDQQIICLCNKGKLGEELIETGFHVEALDKSGRVDFGFFQRLRSTLKAFRPHVLHSSVFTANLWGRLAVLTIHVPVCITHEQSTVSLEKWHRRFFDRILLPRTSRVLAVSQDLKNRLVAEEKLPESKVEVLYNAIDCAAVQATAKSRTEPLPGTDGKRVCVVGRLEYRKDHATLLHAAKRVVAHDTDAHFLFVGDGPDRSKLEALRRELGLEANAHFLGERRDVPALLSATDIYCLSSITEGLSLSILEAMATGCPVIATRVGGNAELLDEGKAGLLVPPRDPEAMAEGLLRLLEDTSLAKDLGDKARQRAESVFDIGQIGRASCRERV